jgi:hypothetical protein
MIHVRFFVRSHTKHSFTSTEHAELGATVGHQSGFAGTTFDATPISQFGLRNCTYHPLTLGADR